MALIRRLDPRRGLDRDAGCRAAGDWRSSLRRHHGFATGFDGPSSARSSQYLNGELSIGRVTGNLFFDFGLADVAVDLSGDRVVAVKALRVDYNFLQLVSRGIVIDHITLVEPRLRMVRDRSGWNIGALVRKRAQEADRRGPGRSVSLPSIAIVDGAMTVDDRISHSAYRYPAADRRSQRAGRVRIRACALHDRARPPELSRIRT